MEGKISLKINDIQIGIPPSPPGKLKKGETTEARRE
jgi:hypothetical protein